jgi:hypothetical protein
MKTSLYWFSGTGNSLSVARAVSRGLGDAELIPIPQAGPQPPAAAPERTAWVFFLLVWAILAAAVAVLVLTQSAPIAAATGYLARTDPQAQPPTEPPALPGKESYDREHPGDRRSVFVPQ